MKTLILILFSFCLSLTCIQAQTTAIPDANFEQSLLYFGIDSDGTLNGQILNSDAASVTSLQLFGANISDLTGIDAFVNLDTLLCNNNNLTTLNVNNNTALRYLSCDDNNLPTLNLNNNTALSHLSCGNNNLSTLNLNNQTLLTDLNCSNNNLTILNLTANTALTRLRCDDNILTSLDVSNNTLLYYLSCNSNNLTTLNLGNNTVLTRLNCSNNNLTTLNLNDNTALTIVHCTNNNLSNINLDNQPALSCLFCNDNNLTYLQLTDRSNLTFMNCRGNAPFMPICVTNRSIALNNNFWKKDSSAIYVENCHSFPLALTGKVVIDNNSNCIADSTESGLSGCIVQFNRISDNVNFHFSTYDTLGNYLAYLDTGTYNVTLIPSSPYWQVCPLSQQVVIDTNNIAQTLNWTLAPIVQCPYLEVDVAAPFLRMTGGGSNYTVSYCNNGTSDAHNVYVEVDLDPDLNFINSSILPSSQTGSLYTFNLGTLSTGQCGDFHIKVVVDSNAQFEQTHCTEAHIYPDSLCTLPWTGPIVDGSSNCQNDTITFSIQNIGANMLSPQSYTIFEDDIAMRVGTIQLNNAQTTTFFEPANAGKTYRIEVNQTAGYPNLLGDPTFSTVIEGCNPYVDGTFNTGFVTQFSNGNSAPYIAVDCQQNIASYDPNDKAAQPVGYDIQHYIERNVPIDYKIRFQNTGTDTAFNIVILDTLSSYLDISSLTMGSSSHTYNWELIGGNVLKVTFPNIMLVDSNTNEPLSHGFFRYKINQVASNPLGTVIENSAAIYFDYNPPIITNTTFHTVGENFVAIMFSARRASENQIDVEAYPNPFISSTTIRVNEIAYNTLQLTIFDLSGKEIKTLQKSDCNKIILHRDNLQQGMYFYQLKGNGELINAGKIIVQ